MIAVEKVGRRHYLVGLPYDRRDAAKEQGCRWDPERRAWWTGKADVADAVLAAASSAAPADTDELMVRGQAEYKGRKYLLVWDGATKYGHGYKLAFRDGSSVFWARGEVRVLKRYERARSVGELQRYKDRMRSYAEDGIDPPVPGCADCRRLGAMCEQCRFDEYDC